MNASEKYPLLEAINTPEDLKKIPENKIPELCSEIRGFLVENVTRTGGHQADDYRYGFPSGRSSGVEPRRCGAERCSAPCIFYSEGSYNF